MPRRLGQHFLKREWVERLIALIAPQSGDVFIEIGAGTGALTLPLAARCARIHAVEIDPLLAERLRARAPANVSVLRANARYMTPLDWKGERVRLVGNLPYYISSPLLRRFLEWRASLLDIHVMLQEEVARRVAADPGSKQYGILSVLYSLWTDSDVPFSLPPSAFDPAPRVRSALLRARLRSTPRAPLPDPDALQLLLRHAFARRRRTLENNLEDSYPNLKEYLRLLNIEGSRRPETLSVVEFAALARTLVLK